MTKKVNTPLVRGLIMAAAEKRSGPRQKKFLKMMLRGLLVRE
jgi:dihydroxyacetone kinase DhaKLM complex PTS-EIIA-like component DhaM